MIENAKITLSDKELNLVCNTEWIFTKHAIIEKIYLLLGNAAANMQEAVKNSSLNTDIKQTTPKISKGENYRLLPYVMLDYPRLFHKENTMAIRTFFWWGNSISIHLLVSGEYKTIVAKKLTNNLTSLQNEEFAICVADTPWEHHFEPDNYLLLKDIPTNDFSNILHRNAFLKLGKKISLTQLGEADFFIDKTFRKMMSLLDN